MSEEIKIKVSQPMFEDGELERFDTYINEIAKEFTKLHFEEKDKILTQRLVQKLEQENEKLKNELEQQNIDMGLYRDSDLETEEGKNKLLDYITNLQEELQAYKQERENILDKSKRLNYKTRIDKAIEHIKKVMQNEEEYEDDYIYNKYLLDILQGSEKK